MLRFIIKSEWRDGYNGSTGEDLSTLDIDLPELEKILSSGGFSETSYQRCSLVGVEVRKSNPQEGRMP